MLKQPVFIKVLLLVLVSIWLLTTVSSEFHLMIYIVGAGLFYLIIDNKSLFSFTLKPLSVEQKECLKGFEYYVKLNPTAQKEFEKRVHYIINHKRFLGRKDLIITEKMKVLIAATITQIGFGYAFISLENFDKIIVFPKAYYSEHSKRFHKGEVNTAGVIVLSWEDFLQGFTISDDGYNVGLHEIAHAFQLEDIIPNSEYHYFQDRDLKRWNKASTAEFNKIRAGNSSFIRSYAGTNRQEFFAVCVEQFFEQAAEFQTQLPELYHALALLLKQDPLMPTKRSV